MFQGRSLPACYSHLARVLLLRWCSSALPDHDTSLHPEHFSLSPSLCAIIASSDISSDHFLFCLNGSLHTFTMHTYNIVKSVKLTFSWWAAAACSDLNKQDTVCWLLNIKENSSWLRHLTWNCKHKSEHQSCHLSVIKNMKKSIAKMQYEGSSS